MPQVLRPRAPEGAPEGVAYDCTRSPRAVLLDRSGERQICCRACVMNCQQSFDSGSRLTVKRLHCMMLLETMGDPMKKEARPVVITIRLSKKEHKHLVLLAQGRGIAIAQLVRTCLMAVEK